MFAYLTKVCWFVNDSQSLSSQFSDSFFFADLHVVASQIVADSSGGNSQGHSRPGFVFVWVEGLAFRC